MSAPRVEREYVHDPKACVRALIALLESKRPETTKEETASPVATVEES